MIKPRWRLFFFLLVFVLLVVNNSTNLEQKPKIAKTHQMIKALNNLPLYFVENKGQVNEYVKYQLKIPNGNVYFTPEEIVYQFFHRKNKDKNQEKGLMREEKEIGDEIKVDNIHVRFVASNKRIKLEGLEESRAKFSYFQGRNPLKWEKGANTYNKIIYKELYPQIDLVLYGGGGRIKSEYRVRVGGEVEKITLKYEGIKQLRVNEKGQLEIDIREAFLREDVPLSYQIINGKKVEVETSYVIENDNTLRFKVGEFRNDRELIIDPDLIYSTYLGGSDFDFDDSDSVNYPMGIAVDTSGNAYVMGTTYSNDFPTTSGAYNTTYPPGSFKNNNIFITKINSTGTELIYSTYLGGNERDYSYGIAVDTNGNAYVTGETYSSDFPTTSGAYDTSKNGYSDAFITKINSTGTELIYSTYLGAASSYNPSYGIAIDTSENAYVVGVTQSVDFPVTFGAYDTSYNGDRDAFITKINSTGTELIYSTYLGGATDSDFCTGIAVDTNGNAYVSGYTYSSDFPITSGAYDTLYSGQNDAFITKINSTGTELIYSTYLGGSSWDQSHGIAVDESGNTYVSGYTYSSDFPTTSGAYDTSKNGYSDAFITKINSTGTELIYSTYLGGSEFDWSNGIAVDESGNAYITGLTRSSDFPTTPNAYDINYEGAGGDAFVTKINSTGAELSYSTYLGGGPEDHGHGIAVDTNGNAYVMGATFSSDFPTSSGGYDTSYNGNGDIFLTKILFNYFDLTISATTGGTTDPALGTYTYDSGTQVSVQATPNSEYQFSHWSGDASGTDNSITITMDSDISITANFSVITTDEDEPEAEAEEKKAPCFIATAAYGSPIHPHLTILRDFRDKYIMPTKIGRVLVHFYYKYSPFVAELIARHKVLKMAVRINLLPLVVFSYLILHFGPIITAVAGIFIFVLPIFLISFFRRKLSQP